MRTVLMTIAAAALMGGAAQAQDIPDAAASGQPAAAAQAAQGAPSDPAFKVLYVCGEDQASWRSLSRDMGIPEFVTAKQVRADRGKAWAEPKCITPAELRRLHKLQIGRLSANTLTPVR